MTSSPSISPHAATSPETGDAAAINDLTALLRQAVQQHQYGAWEEAERLYRRILQIDPEHFDALYLLGTVAMQTGHLALADDLLERAIRINPNHHVPRLLAGQVLLELQRHDDALRQFNHAQRLQPHSAEVRLLRGTLLLEMHRYLRALGCFQRVLQQRPDEPEALAKAGRALYELKQFEAALDYYNRSLHVRPEVAEVLRGRGQVQEALHEPLQALASYECAARIAPEDALAHMYCAYVLFSEGRFDEALARCHRALQLAPTLLPALNLRGMALLKLNLFDEALQSFDLALAIAPQESRVRNNRGLALYGLDRPEEALLEFDHAIRLEPDRAASYNDRGCVLARLNRHADALADFTKALQLDPHCIVGKWNESISRLALGEYRLGWALYESRFELAALPGSDRGLPLWQGEDIAGKTILLTAEQGLGDVLQFVRYAPLVAARGANVVLLVQPSLTRLLSSVEGVQHVVDLNAPTPDAELYCPLMSLPHRFQTSVETIPACIPYIHAAPSDIAVWKARMAADGPEQALRVGLVWAGSARKSLANREMANADARRSITLQHFAPCARVPEILFYSVQKGEPAAQAAMPPAGMRLIDHTASLLDFGQTAALVMNLDLLITVDTSVAHLAGALGQPVWVLNRFDRCWRWLQGRADTPWYPSMRLFQQTETGQWEMVMEAVARELACLVEQKAGGRSSSRMVGA